MAKSSRSKNVVRFPTETLIRVKVEDPKAATCLQIYDQRNGRQVIGNWFDLTRGSQKARCELSTHPQGWELRLILRDGNDGGETSRICHSEAEVFETGDAWRAAALDQMHRFANVRTMK